MYKFKYVILTFIGFKYIYCVYNCVNVYVFVRKRVCRPTKLNYYLTYMIIFNRIIMSV